jgi:hypothetical protein
MIDPIDKTVRKQGWLPEGVGGDPRVRRKRRRKVTIAAEPLLKGEVRD